MTSLRRRFIEDMQIRNLSVNTQYVYVREVSKFARHFNQSPELLGREQIRAYQVYLTNQRKLATSSILIAISALRFLYKVTLKKNWTFEDIIPAPKKPQTLPVVLSPEEVIQFLDCVESRKHRAILTACYGAGLRVSESVALTPPAIDSKRMVVRVDQGKGRKEGSLRDALPETAADPARVVESGKASALALPRRYTGTAHHPTCG